MRTKDFYYHLPQELIAQEPIHPRDHSRLFLYDREKGEIKHNKFYDLPDSLGPGDVLVLNNTKVFPARLLGHKDTGGKIEILV